MPSEETRTSPSETGPAGKMRRHVEIVPLGNVDQIALSVVAANIQAVAGLLADITQPRPDPEYALIPARQQYNAIPILKTLERDAPQNVLRLGLTEKDLCLPIFSYVLGEAQVNGRAAVVSLFRLMKEGGVKPVEPGLGYERLAKVALHEIAHVLGLRHCRNSGCLMQFSPGAEHVDGLALGFCDGCEGILRTARIEV